jgi:hypothetical protein
VASRFDDVEEVLDRHARRVARELGGLFVDVGEALRRAADRERAPSSVTEEGREPTKEDLYREATRLGVRGRSGMTKEELRNAIERLR